MLVSQRQPVLLFLSDKGSQPSESRELLQQESLKSMQIHVHLSQPGVCLSA